MNYRNKNGQFKKGITQPYSEGITAMIKYQKEHAMTDTQKKERGWYYVGKEKWYWKNCDNCGKEYKKPWAEKFCSMSCSNFGVPRRALGDRNATKRLEVRKKISQALRGEKSPWWNGGITPINNQIRKSWEYKFWRQQVFERDNYACVLCGKTGGRIEADHIKAFSQIKYEYKITSLEQALLCEELWDINNGRTLCKSCH